MDTANAMLNPERQFVGCLMCAPLGPARRLLAGMRAADLADPMASHVLQLAIEVVAAGRTPAPVAVFAHAVTTGRVPGETSRSRLGMWLADTYTATQVPSVADYLKTVVLEEAWRRAVAERAQRLVQAADVSPTEVLRDLNDDTARADELWTRYEAAARGIGPTTLTEVTRVGVGRPDLRTSLDQRKDAA